MVREYEPREGSVAWNVIEFFKRRPDEELSTLDIAIKYGARERSVHIVLANAIKAGWIRRWDGRSPTNKPLAMYGAGIKITKHQESQCQT